MKRPSFLHHRHVKLLAALKVSFLFYILILAGLSFYIYTSLKGWFD